MKKLSYILGLSLIISAYSCSSTYHAGSSDDVYYSTKDPVPAPVSSPTPSSSGNYDNGSYDNNYQDNQNDQSQYNSPNYSNTERYSDEKGNTYITNNYYDDYYDYEYSSRLRRFYNPAYGYGYYDPFYTNSYWYDHNPSSWGVSIYLGYNWWAPSYFYYDPFNYGGWSIGIGYGSYWGPHWGSYWGPHWGSWGYSPYYHGGGYYHGYNHGYWDGYAHGYSDGYYGYSNPYYYNSYDSNSHYYGPRGSTSSNSPRAGTQRQNTIAPLSAKYEKAVADGRISKAPASESRIRTEDDKKGVRTPSQQNSKSDQRPAIDKDQGKNSDTRINQKPPQNRTNPSNKNENARPSDDSRQPSRNEEINRAPKDSRQPGEMPRNDQKEIDMRQNPRNERSNPREQNEQRQNTKPRSDVSPKNDMDRPNPRIETPKQERRPNIQSDIRIDNSNSRQENKTPIFQPRNEPKLYKQESAPVQRTQPSQPSRNENRSNNSNGQRRR